jgi:hypothetical protein
LSLITRDWSSEEKLRHEQQHEQLAQLYKSMDRPKLMNFLSEHKLLENTYKKGVIISPAIGLGFAFGYPIYLGYERQREPKAQTPEQRKEWLEVQRFGLQ